MIGHTTVRRWRGWLRQALPRLSLRGVRRRASPGAWPALLRVSGPVLCVVGLVPVNAESGGLANPAPAAHPVTAALLEPVLRAYAVGDIADCRRRPADQSAARLTAGLVTEGALVLALGDIAYQYTTAVTLADCYEPTWGVHRRTTLAIAGNHDYVGGAADAFRSYFGLGDGIDPRFIAYTRWLNTSWFLVALDTNVAGAALDAQYAWLQTALENEFGQTSTSTSTSTSTKKQTKTGLDTATPAVKTRCIAVMWHTPLFSSGLHRGSGEHMQRFWQLLDSYEADLVLSGHEHFYEAFEPRDSNGAMRSGGEGLRQFVVGTGGARLYGFWKPPYASRARVVRHGVLRLTLKPATYAWEFVAVNGQVYDSGAAPCRHRVRPHAQGPN